MRTIDGRTEGRLSTGSSTSRLRCRLRKGVALLLLAAAAMPACRREEAPAAKSEAVGKADPWFEEVAAFAKVDFKHDSGHGSRFYLPEIMCGGVGLLDYDGDGFLDVYITQFGALDREAGTEPPANKLYRNKGDGTFEDVTAEAGVGDTGYGNGCACGDYDGDGDTDLYVSNLGPNVLYRNNGDGTFTDVTDVAGVADPSWSTSCAFLDYDGDGNLDLYVANYINWSKATEMECYSGGLPDYCHPKVYKAPARDTLYRNAGDGTFVDVSLQVGLGRNFGHGLGVACADYNLDGRMDIYVANDGMANQLWLNTGDGRFSEEALISGCALNQHGIAEAGMGVAPIDIDNDGDPDLFMSHLRGETNTFYLNEGGMFEDSTAVLGLASVSVEFTGFGLGFADFDHDGHMDLYVANGRVKFGAEAVIPGDPFAEPDLLFRGRPGGGFEEVVPRGGTAELLVRTGRGAALGDLDNDGDIDIVVVNKDAGPFVLRNVAGSRGNWVMFRLLDRRGVYAVGALARIDAGGLIRWRCANPHYSYCSSNDPRIHCGLGSADTVDNVTVRWPNGSEESFGPFSAGRQYELRQGSSQADGEPDSQSSERPSTPAGLP